MTASVSRVRTLGDKEILVTTVRWTCLVGAIVECEDIPDTAGLYWKFVNLIRGGDEGGVLASQTRRAINGVFERRGIVFPPSPVEDQAQKFRAAWQSGTLGEFLREELKTEFVAGSAALEAMVDFEAATGIEGIADHALLLGMWDILYIDPTELDDHRVAEGLGNFSLLYGHRGGDKRREARKVLLDATGGRYVDVEAEKLLARIVTEAHVVQPGRGGLLAALQKHVDQRIVPNTGTYKGWHQKVRDFRRTVGIGED